MRLLFFLAAVAPTVFAPSWVPHSSYYGYIEPQRDCRDPFAQENLYVLVSLDMNNLFSYCSGCIMKHGKLYGPATSSVVGKSKPGFERWFDKWQVKKRGSNQAEFVISGIGALTAEEGNDKDGAVTTALLVSPEKPYTAWTYDLVPNRKGLCVVTLRDPQRRYIRRATKQENLTSILPNSFAQVATKILPNSDAYNFVVYRVIR